MGLKNRFFGVKFLLAVFGIAFVLLAILATPLFHVRTVTFSGSTVYSDESLIRVMGLSEGSSIFYLSGRRMERELEALPYIRSAQVTRSLPSALEVRLTERIPKSIIFDARQGLYVTIDSDGYVLEILSQPTEGLTVITGLRLAGYSLGDALYTDGANLMPTVIRLSGILDRYGMTNVARVDISDLYDIALSVNNITIRIGSMLDADIKIMRAVTLLDFLDTSDRGTLFVYNTDNAYFAFGN